MEISFSDYPVLFCSHQNDAGPADQQAPAVGAEAGNQGNQRPANPVRPMNFLDMMGIEAEQEEDEEGAENNNGANPPNVALQGMVRMIDIVADC